MSERAARASRCQQSAQQPCRIILMRTTDRRAVCLHVPAPVFISHIENTQETVVHRVGESRRAYATTQRAYCKRYPRPGASHLHACYLPGWHDSAAAPLRPPTPSAADCECPSHTIARSGIPPSDVVLAWNDTPAAAKLVLTATALPGQRIAHFADTEATLLVPHPVRGLSLRGAGAAGA